MQKLKRYKMSDTDFERFRRLVKEASGMFFDREKMEVLRAGLSDRAGSLGAADLSEYYDYVTAGNGSREELRRLVAHLTVQETDFFRNRPQFDALQKFIIPEIARRKAADHRTLRFWCAGCSTGQEPYSVAMSVFDILPDPDSWSIQILGTDLNEAALDAAARGWYPEKKLAGINRRHRELYFHADGEGYRVNDALRRLISFQRHNLIDDPLPFNAFGTCDAVFCRNVIIYFTHDTAKLVVEKFFDIMNPGAYLFLGHSETLWKMSTKYSLVEIGDAFVYRKPVPVSLDGHRFINDRRLQNKGLPADVPRERRRARQAGGGAGEPATGKITARTVADAGDSGEKTDSAQASIGRARAHLDLGEYEQALACLEGALAADGANAEIHFVMGLVHEKMNLYERAAEDFRRALYFDAELGLARFHLANVFEKTGKLKNAVREYRNAGKSFQENPPGEWEAELEAFDARSLMNLCQWKIENLGGVGG